MNNKMIAVTLSILIAAFIVGIGFAYSAASAPSTAATLPTVGATASFLNPMYIGAIAAIVVAMVGLTLLLSHRRTPRRRTLKLFELHEV